VLDYKEIIVFLQPEKIEAEKRQTNYKFKL